MDAHAWGPVASGPVADQVAALGKARGQWTAVAQAEDADTFHGHCGRGSTLLEGTRAVTARKALGPVTAPPMVGDGAEAGRGTCERGHSGEKVPA